MKYQDHTIVMGKISVVLLVLVSGCTGFENTSKPNKVSSQVPTPTPTPTPTTASTPAPNPFESVSFPLDVCGDKLPDDQKVYPVSLYPVFLEYSEEKLTKIKSSFCRDAFKKVREDTGKEEIQVASFIGSERANQFKELIGAKAGISGRIGQPTAIAVKSDRTPAAPTTPPPTSTPNESLVTSSSDFQDITIKCREKQTGKYIDLEFGDCWSGHAKCKNYSSSWYESSSGDNKLQLIGPGEELVVRLPQRNYLLDDVPNYPLKIRRLTARPLRTIAVNCKDSAYIIWGITIIPKCTSSGSYIDIETGNGSVNDYPIIVKTPSGSVRFNNNRFEPKTWYVTSKASQVELTFSVELKR